MNESLHLKINVQVCSIEIQPCTVQHSSGGHLFFFFLHFILTGWYIWCPPPSLPVPCVCIIRTSHGSRRGWLAERQLSGRRVCPENMYFQGADRKLKECGRGRNQHGPTGTVPPSRDPTLFVEVWYPAKTGAGDLVAPDPGLTGLSLSSTLLFAHDKRSANAPPPELERLYDISPRRGLCCSRCGKSFPPVGGWLNQVSRLITARAPRGKESGTTIGQGLGGDCLVWPPSMNPLMPSYRDVLDWNHKDQHQIRSNVRRTGRKQVQPQQIKQSIITSDLRVNFPASSVLSEVCFLLTLMNLSSNFLLSSAATGQVNQAGVASVWPQIQNISCS